MGVGPPVMHPLSLKSGRREWGRESLATIVVLYRLSVGVGGGHFEAIQPLARPPGDAPTFWR